MKRLRKAIIATVIATMVLACFNAIKPNEVSANSIIQELELVSDNMEWTYLDDLVTDPNSDTWYESWNKKNGWTYPLLWKDWGVYLQGFSDEDWKTHTGSPKFSTDVADVDAAILDTRGNGTAGPTYFFRHIFELENPKDVKTIKVTVRYNDAMILYLNGKPLESFFNIPTSNYTSNLQYGSQIKVTDKYIEETIYMEDVSSLVDVYNPDLKEFAIAAEIHCSDENDTDAYFELVSFELNPDVTALPTSEAVKNVAVNVGEDETSVNFSWYAKSITAGAVQIVEGTDTTGVFPEGDATIITSTQPIEAYIKFYDVRYYSNKAVFDGIEPGKDYIYRVGNVDGWSETYSLKTTDISDGSYEIIFLSDAQVGTGTIPTDKLGWKTTLELALEAFPNTSFIANTGDFVDISTKESEYDAYFSPTILNSYPTASAVGNHDIAVNYGYHFNEPNMSNLGLSATNTGDYYYVYGNVLYMVLNTSNTNHSEHVQFMEETIAATANQEFDWKVVMFHQSIYASGKQSTSNDVEGRRNALVPAFDELGIDIVLMGHDHCYARTYQMYNFSPVADVKYDQNGAAINPQGTVYLTTSSASGSKYYDLETKYEYLAARAQSYVPTFSHLTFSEDTFTMTAYRTDTMEAFDSYTIKKVVETEETNVLNVSDVEIKYEEATEMNAEKMIALSGAKVIDTTTNQEVEGYTITVNEEELQAIKKASEEGGRYNLTITATEQSLTRLEAKTFSVSITVEVLAKTASNPTTPIKGVNTGDTTGVTIWMWLLLASGFAVTGVYAIKKRKESKES